MWIRVSAVLLAGASGSFVAGVSPNDFDHTYATYGQLLRYVRPPRVDYAALKADRAALDRAVAEFDSGGTRAESGWTREQRMAFWINAYNAFTLRVIVDHYPIRAGLLTLQPRNSIRQIDGVWTDVKWRAAGRTVTLDDIEHRTLRPFFKDARIHFAVNCASVSCPPLAAQPYRPDTLDAQLNDAARAYLASPEGLRVDGDTLRVSTIFKWYGEDFVAEYSRLAPGAPDLTERAILGTVIKHGPSAATELARSGRARIAFLDYNWSLNDVAQ
jgi:Protein of unknown function, DUF547